MPDVEVRGSSLHYEEVGTGPTLVLLHGIGADGRQWALQKGALSAGHRLILPDLKGHGGSASPIEPSYSPFEHAKDVVALMDLLKVERAWFIGLSAGGFTSLALALDHAPRVEGLVLVATTAHVDKYTQAVGKRWAEAYQQGGIAAYVDLQLRDIFYPDWLIAHMDQMSKFQESQKGRNLLGVGPSAVANASWDVRSRIGKIKLPTLVVHGMDDRVVDPTSARILRQTILGSEVKLYANTGHMVIIERADEFNSLVLDFLSRKSAGAVGAEAPAASGPAG